MWSLKGEFNNKASQKDEFKVLTTAVKLPSGAIEVITNTQEIDSKIEYLKNAYDNDFKLKNNPEVQIVGFMLV